MVGCQFIILAWWIGVNGIDTGSARRRDTATISFHKYPLSRIAK
jgi:hypothetical protein